VRRALLIVIGILALLLVAIVLAALFLAARPPAAQAPEQQSSEAARREPASPPSQPVEQIGSGQVVRGDWWEVAFTEPRYPDEPANHHGGLDERLVSLIDRAAQTVDVAVYDFDLANVAAALARARQRGVRVRVVTDTDTYTNQRDEAVQAAFRVLRQAEVPIVQDQRSDLMHHKFTVVDGEWVQTGSWNYTDGDTYRLNNNQFIARSPDLAANYTAEFEKMFVQRRFGPQKPAGGTRPLLSVNGARVESYFAPTDGISGRLADAIARRTSRRLAFLAFSFTDDAIARSMLDRAARGVEVQGVFETTGSNTPVSEYGKLKQAGLDVYQDGNPWIMHHKVIILDDKTVAFGSFNFSANADRSNDENLLLVEDPRLAAAFQAEFERVLTLAKNPPTRRR
jgi:phosphatidylserine/phosphatidylglycerophosphate/cardiolipin synthase-like enzyme